MLPLRDTSASRTSDPQRASVAPRDEALDGLRGIAIALVLWHHLFEPFLPAFRDSWLGAIRSASHLSWCGVDLFFVLSGYFIGGILIDHRDSPRLARVFYLRRAVRILPLYYLTLGVVLALVALGAPHAYRSFPPGIYLLFLTNFALAASSVWDWIPLSVLWSIAVEEQFYLAAPWVIRAISARRLPWLLGALIAGAWLARLIAVQGFQASELAIHVQMPFRMDALASGFLVSWATRSPQAASFFEHLGRWWRTCLAGALAALGALTLLRPKEGGILLAGGGYTVLALTFGLLVAIVARVRPPSINRWLSARPLVLLGRYSYCMYLWHGLIGLYVIRFLIGDAPVLDTPLEFAAAAASTAATFAFALLSWRLLESPLLAWGRRWSYD